MNINGPSIFLWQGKQKKRSIQKPIEKNTCFAFSKKRIQLKPFRFCYAMRNLNYSLRNLFNSMICLLTIVVPPSHDDSRVRVQQHWFLNLKNWGMEARSSLFCGNHRKKGTSRIPSSSALLVFFEKYLGLLSRIVYMQIYSYIRPISRQHLPYTTLPSLQSWCCKTVWRGIFLLQSSSQSTEPLFVLPHDCVCASGIGHFCAEDLDG